MVGGAGVNTYVVNSPADVIVDPGHNGILMTGNAAVAMSSLFKNLVYTGSDPATLAGSSSSNLIVDKGSASNTMIGGTGSDTLVAGTGNDLLLGSADAFNFGQVNAPAGINVMTVAALPTGEILWSGMDQNGEAMVAQYTSGGLLDTTFGAGGFLSLAGEESILRLGDGSFLGLNTLGGTGSYTRYTSAAIADTKTGAGGALQVPAGITLGDATSVTAFADGSFVIGATDSLSNTLEAHYGAGGKFDAVYAVPAGGTLLGDGSWLVGGADSLGNPSFTHILSNGKTDTLVSRTGVLGVPTMKSGSGKTAVTLTPYTLDGTVAETFAGGGFVLQGTDSLQNVVDLAYGSGGKYLGAYMDTLASGATYLPDGSFLIPGSDSLGNPVYTHALAGGSVDTVLGASTSGKKTIPGNGLLPVPAGITLGGFDGLSGSLSPTLGDGSYLFYGTDSLGETVLFHETPAFALDSKFGTGGVLTLAAGQSLGQQTVLSDGSLLIAGTDSLGNAVYTHQLADGSQDPAFGSDTAGDSLVGGAGNDTLVSGPGVSTLVGGSGTTTFYVNNSSDVLKQSSSGTATVIASTGVNAGSLAGALSSVTYTGMAGAAFTLPASGTSLVAGPGNDMITGGKGNDTMDAFGSLTGGTTTTQRDTITGGEGADLFILGDSSGTYYLDGNASHGSASYAFIPDFNLSDTLQLAASDQSGYSLITASSDSTITKALGSAVKSTDYLLEDLTGGTPDLIAVLRSTSRLTSGILDSNVSYV